MCGREQPGPSGNQATLARAFIFRENLEIIILKGLQYIKIMTLFQTEAKLCS